MYQIQAKGRYSVTLSELTHQFDASEKAILQSLFRLKRKGKLAQVRKGFYVIIPPQYSVRGMIPTSLFIGDLMNHLKRDYYVGLLSASALHGAGHQQPMQFQVIIRKPPIRNINNEKLNIHFYVKSRWEEEEIVNIKTETGFINVSSPSLTAFDLVRYHKKIGGLNRIFPILEDLKEEIKTDDLKRVANKQKITELQRLGYLFEQLECEHLSSVLHKMLSKNSVKEIPLSLGHQKGNGVLYSKWNLILNTQLNL